MYKGMKKFVELPYERCREMGLAARQHMEDNFDKKRVVESTVKCLFLRRSGNKMEAMACGLPCGSAAFGGILI